MKNLSLTFLLSMMVFFFLSCSKSSSTNNRTGSATYSWSCKINGTPYSWSGPYPSNTAEGQATFVSSATLTGINLNSFRTSLIIPCSITISLPPSITSPGNYTISQSSYQANNGYSAFIIQLNTSNDITKTDIYSTQRGGQMKVNINSVGPLLGKVSGTFEGTIQGQ